ncbi:hypothetical protein [Acetobacter orleanensis]|uniref:hypothetical protein n=1 Tax=Acetobacter orleanensis TaxID=104099 RepID=UPI000A4A5BC6|nr:hypothetical protein [Acetobacter orleanensis]
MKRFFSPARRAVAGLCLLSLLGLAACADDHSQHYYHPRNHHGQRGPNWYRPPPNTQN